MINTSNKLTNDSIFIDNLFPKNMVKKILMKVKIKTNDKIAIFLASIFVFANSDVRPFFFLRIFLVFCLNGCLKKLNRAPINRDGQSAAIGSLIFLLAQIQIYGLKEFAKK